MDKALRYPRRKHRSVPVALNRKNALFAGSDGEEHQLGDHRPADRDGENNAANPHAWLTDTLTKLVNGWPQSRIDDLMPWAIALMCHGRLTRNRPAASHLTLFYLAISLGGVVGGVFASLVAPQIFSWIAEYPLLLIAAALCLPWRPPSKGYRVWIAGGLVVAGLVGLAVSPVEFLAREVLSPAIVVAALAGGVLAWRNAPLFALALGVAFATPRVYPPEADEVVTYRSFVVIIGPTTTIYLAHHLPSRLDRHAGTELHAL